MHLSADSETDRAGGVKSVAAAADSCCLADVAVKAMGLALCHVDPCGRLTFDAAARAKFGTPEHATLRRALSRVARQHRRALTSLIRTARFASDLQPVEFQLGDEASAAWVKATIQRVDGHCAGQCAVVSLLDVTAEHQTMEALRQSEEHLRYTVEYNPQLPWIADPSGNILDITDRWLAATGLSRERALGEGWSAVTHPDDIEDVNRQIFQALQTGESFDVRVRLRVHDSYRWMRAQGHPRRDESGNIVRWYGYTEDIHEHVLVEEQLRWNAEHDPLTSLPNRLLFNKRLELSLQSALQSLERVGILLLDIDHFKEVNDLLGHHAGDALLQRYAQQLQSILPSDATVSRLGGDEFAILFPRISDQSELARWGERVLRLREPFVASGRSIECRASVGAAMFPEHGRLCSELLRHCDIALYAAKEGGRGRLLMFETSMQDAVQQRVAMVNRARTAVEDGNVIPYYQPKVSLTTGKLVGFEALLRWRDNSGRIHLPGTIHAAFEEHDVSNMLGRRMQQQVMADIALWRQLGLDFGSVAINAAPAEFRQPDFAQRLIAHMDEAGIAPEDIEVEITEGVFLGRGSDYAKEAIKILDEYGIRIVLDDFGTGFASLSHLRALPVDTLKIDRSFVAQITEAAGDAAIVSAIINLGRNLGIHVVAEGIETSEQAAVLRAHGCELAQGYYFGRPIPGDDIPDLIRNWGGRKSVAAPRRFETLLRHRLG